MRPINYDGQGRVMAYHCLVNADGSTTEHTAMVNLVGIPNAKRNDGSDDPDALILACPTCGARAWVPATGGSEARELHARVQLARGAPPPTTK